VQIKHCKIFVNDQEKALAFYRDILGFQVHADFSNTGYRWLTVVSPDAPDGTELQLELNSNPAASAFQSATYDAGLPAMMFYSDSLQADFERMQTLGANFTMAPTDVTGSIIAKVDDGVGNLVQLTQLTWNG
jgi:catechol 2,3-dioxygenase-like lactoylglutathione lyase family enzyme